jgi:membrane-bound lytic murein transglycosylase B
MMTKIALLASLYALHLLTTPLLAADKVYVNLQQDNVVAFIDEMVESHGFDRDALSAILAQAEVKATIVKKISTPAERTLTWGEYRKIFITKERINAGVAFWRENKEMLERIALETDVPIEILVGIIGVETYYGRITGKDRVIDALATLAFEYPKRAKFFRNELLQFLILAREEELDPLTPMGSYAGAMGRPQFMPSSFRAYAVDSTGDGKRDIWNNWADVSGSIANYFLEHRWRKNEAVATQASLGSKWTADVPQPANTLKVTDSVDSLSKKGVLFATDLGADSEAQLLTYEGDDGIEHWVGFHNFYVITKYNRSVMYALAVHQLGQEISAKMNADAP